MLKCERTSVMNFENAIRGARNPMNSWGRMDSGYDEEGNFVLGPNDMSLARFLYLWILRLRCTGGRSMIPIKWPPWQTRPVRCIRFTANHFPWMISAMIT